MAAFPEIGEFVLVSVNKVMPYGAFCSLDEYQNVEAFLHVSEVSSGWVKNIRDFVKEGQKTVAMVSRIDLEKRQIDLSLKRVSEGDRKRKLEGFQLNKRAEKLLERAAQKLKKNLKDANKEIGAILIAEYGDLYSSFEKIKSGEFSDKIPAVWLAALKEVAEAEIKEKVIDARAELKIQSFDSNGVEKIQLALLKVQKSFKSVSITYIGAPKYFLDFTVKDHKDVDKTISKVKALLDAEKGVEVEITKLKG
ncbi:S1 RNA-binding domain-containing protein [Candidatus Micrarchaeota archaeon]|nr:S1 RNA-binding domain-containing protein [Candidatus Micrarchaeota archaeon]